MPLCSTRRAALLADLATRTAVALPASLFASTTTLAVRRHRRRKFRSFLREPGEFRDLLMHLLETCFREAQVCPW